MREGENVVPKESLINPKRKKRSLEHSFFSSSTERRVPSVVSVASMIVRELDPDSERVVEVVEPDVLVDEEDESETLPVLPVFPVAPDVSGREGRLWTLPTVWTTGTICLPVIPPAIVKAVGIDRSFRTTPRALFSSRSVAVAIAREKTPVTV